MVKCLAKLSAKQIKSATKLKIFELRMEGASLWAIAEACDISLVECNQSLIEVLKDIKRKCALSLKENDAVDFEKTRLSLNREMRHESIDPLQDLRQLEQEAFEAIR